VNKIILPGLAVYCVISGLGLFIGSGLSSPLLFPWISGYLILVFAISYSSLFDKDPSSWFSFILLGIICLNFLIQISGGSDSPAYPAYFLLAAAASFQRRGRPYLATGTILCIEAGNILAVGRAGANLWAGYAGFALSLFGVAFITSHITTRIRNDEQTAKENYDKLISDASAVDPLAGGANVEALTEKNRQATNVGMAREREGAFAGLIEMISGIVPAHTYALFLDDRDDGVFTLRGMRSQSKNTSQGTVRISRGSGLIGICVDKNQMQYLPDMVIPTRSLGYYALEVPVQSFLAIPITQGDRVIGALVVDSLERDAFPDDTRQMLTRFAPFFTQIIEKIRISLEMDIRAKNFAALHEMSSVLSSSLEISAILDKLSVQIQSVIPYQFCAFTLYQEKTDEAVITALRGYPAKFIGSRFPIEQSAILSHMFTQWRDRGIAKIHYDPNLGARGSEISLFPIKELHKPIQSLYGQPLVARGKFIGAVFLGSDQANAFTDYYLNFMNTILNQVSIVIDNTTLHQNIRDMARTDGLTGLLNHRTFMEKLSEEYKRLEREPRNFSILLMDIDKFKNVNDKYGHPVGDIAIKAVAKVLDDTIRGTDFVARYGGEEFAVGMVETDAKGAGLIAERVRKIMENTVAARVFDGELRISLSIGVASFPLNTRKFEDLVSLADQALYHAKRSGRNRVSLYGDVPAVEPSLAPSARIS